MENTRMMRRKTREQRRKLMRKQKLYGLVFVLLHPDLPGVRYWKDPGR